MSKTNNLTFGIMRVSYGTDIFEAASAFERTVVTFPVKGNDIRVTTGNVLQYTNGNYAIDGKAVHGVQVVRHS